MRLLLILIALFFVTPALADTTAVYSTRDGRMTMTVEIATTGEIRITMGGAMLAELKKQAPAGVNVGQLGGIVRDGENYMLQPGPDGKVVVVRMRDAATVMKDFLAEHKRDFPMPPNAALAGPMLIERGTLMIHGRSGKAFYFDRSSSGPVAVISADPDLAELGKAMRDQFSYSAQMMASTGFPAMGGNMAAVLAQGAPLAYAGMELLSVTHDAIPAARFALPGAPASLEAVRALMAPRTPAKP